MLATMTSWLVRGRPRQFMEMWENNRCSILFHFEVPGGRWHTHADPAGVGGQVGRHSAPPPPAGVGGRGGPPCAPPLRYGPTSSFFLVSTLITGSPLVRCAWACSLR